MRSSQPLLQTSRGRQPGSPRRRRWRALSSLLLALLFTGGLAAVGSSVLSRLLGSDWGGDGFEGGEEAAAGGDSSSSSSHSRDSSSGAEPWTVRGLEEAYRGLASGSDSSSHAATLTEPEALAAARVRAEKAAALPAPELRSHAGGMELSPSGALATAAACAGERCDLVARFVLAAEEVARLAESGGCAVQHCPDALGIGLRPLPYTSHAFGNRCEPLWNRGALEVVRQLIAPEWRVLEWFTGGSTSWFLARMVHLTSIEAAKGFARKASAVAAAQFEQAFLDSHWQLRLEPPRSRVLTFEDTESAELWEDYCGARFLPANARFDLIAVQGFARMACLRRAVELLEPQGGLLVLPQAQRRAYRGADGIVPAHWLRLSDTHLFGTTLVWMSIRKPGEDARAADAGAALVQER